MWGEKTQILSKCAPGPKKKKVRDCENHRLTLILHFEVGPEHMLSRIYANRKIRRWRLREALRRIICNYGNYDEGTDGNSLSSGKLATAISTKHSNLSNIYILLLLPINESNQSRSGTEAQCRRRNSKLAKADFGIKYYFGVAIMPDMYQIMKCLGS